MTRKSARRLTCASLGSLLLTLVVVAAACGGAGGTVAGADNPVQGGGSQASNATLRPGDPIPAPAAAVVLTVTGLVEASGGAPVQLDIATIDQIGLQTVSVYEPFVQKDMTFQGIDVADLLAVLRPAANASDLHLVALDDYIVNLDVDDVRSGGTMLATHNGDGSPIEIDQGGPIRVVFLDGAVAGPTPNEWIWSLATAEVR